MYHFLFLYVSYMQHAAQKKERQAVETNLLCSVWAKMFGHIKWPLNIRLMCLTGLKGFRFSWFTPAFTEQRPSKHLYWGSSSISLIRSLSVVCSLSGSWLDLWPLTSELREVTELTLFKSPRSPQFRETSFYENNKPLYEALCMCVLVFVAKFVSQSVCSDTCRSQPAQNFQQFVMQ